MKSRILAIILTLCLAAGLLAGCASGSETSPSASTSANPSASTAPSAATSDDPRSKLVSYMDLNDPMPKQGGDLVLNVGWWPDFYLPAVSGNGMQMLICPAIEALGRQLPDKSWIPFLVEEWTENAKDATFTLKLREGIKFHDGSELNAEVVQWNLEQKIAAGRGADICDPTGFKKIDEYTLEIQFEEYSNVWIEQYGMVRIVSKKTYDEKGRDYMSSHAVGTGAYIQDELVQGTSIKFVKNPDYWQEGLPYLDSITCMNITDANTQLSAMLNGEINGLSVSKGSVKAQLAAASNLKEQEAKTSGYNWIAVQAKNEDLPYADVKVRQALMYGIDRESLAVALTEGMSHARCQFANPGQLDYLENPNKYEYDLEKAKSLLAEAGYPNGFETVIEGVQTQEPTAVAIQSALKDMGITATISLLDTSTHTQIKASGDIKGINNWGGSSQASSMCNFYGRYVGPNRNTYVNSNPSIPELDKLILDIPYIADRDELKAQCQEMGKIFNEQLPMLPFYGTESCYFMADNLYGYEYFGAWQWTPETAYFA